MSHPVRAVLGVAFVLSLLVWVAALLLVSEGPAFADHCSTDPDPTSCEATHAPTPTPTVTETVTVTAEPDPAPAPCGSSDDPCVVEQAESQWAPVLVGLSVLVFVGLVTMIGSWGRGRE